MDRPLREHITHLEQRLRDLNTQIMENRRTQAESNRLQAEIRFAEMALVYYRKALELEKQISH
jgi:uncharacterized protein YigA (DUF484 family)